MRHQVQQPPRGGDDDICAAAQGHQLRIDGFTAGGGDDLQPSRQGRCQRQQGLRDLRDQLTRRHQDQPAQHARHLFRRLQALLQQRQGIRQGLARAGLRGDDQVACGQHRRNHRDLDRRERAHTGPGERGLEQGR